MRRKYIDEMVPESSRCYKKWPCYRTGVIEAGSQALSKKFNLFFLQPP